MISKSTLPETNGSHLKHWDMEDEFPLGFRPPDRCELLGLGSVYTGWIWVVVSIFFYVHPYLGKISNLTNIFQIG